MGINTLFSGRAQDKMLRCTAAWHDVPPHYTEEVVPKLVQLEGSKFAVYLCEPFGSFAVYPAFLRT